LKDLIDDASDVLLRTSLAVTCALLSSSLRDSYSGIAVDDAFHQSSHPDDFVSPLPGTDHQPNSSGQIAALGTGEGPPNPMQMVAHEAD
jgi:hypothetical protein